MSTVHMFGFVNDAGDWIAGEASVTDETVKEVTDRLGRHHDHFGREPEHLSITRTLDGRLVGVEFEVPDDGTAARMWHRVTSVRETWPDFLASPLADTPTEDQ